MRTTAPPFRLVAVVVGVVLLLTVSAPANAHADVMTTLAIVSLVVVGVIIVGYLIVANVAERRRGDEGQVVWVATAAPGVETEGP